jgi:hypothetical protein
MTAFRSMLAIIFIFAVCGSAHAQVMHRTNVPAGDATPTGGSFSIHFPVAFSDAELKAEEAGSPTAIVFMLTGADSDRIRFTATETPFPGIQPKPMEDFMESVKQRPGAAVTDVHRESSNGQEILSFSLAGPEGGYYFRMVRANNSQYMQVVQFPETRRDKAAGMKEDFFNSFKLTGNGGVSEPKGK